MKAYIDPEECIGCGLCEAICPAVFEMDDETNLAIVIVDEVPKGEEDNAEEAAESCPTSAITIE